MLNQLSIDFFLSGYKGYLALQSFERYLGKFKKCYSLRNTPGEQFDIIEATRLLNLRLNHENGDNKNRDRVAICVGWQKIILEDYKKVIVFHESLLPKLRGWNPLVTAIENGHHEIGVSVFYGGSEVDSGPVIFQQSTAIIHPITLQAALLKLCDIYDRAAHYLSGFDSLENLPIYMQDHSLATYSLWRDEHDFVIDWSKSNVMIQNFVNSRSWPYRGAITSLSGMVLRVLRVQIYDNDVVLENRTPGKVFGFSNGCPIVVCGFGMVIITELREEDGSVFSIKKHRTRFF